MSRQFNFYQKLIRTAEACELKTISDDDCCRLLAWLYVFGSEYEAVLFNMKLNTDIQTAQQRLNIGPSLTPNPALLAQLRGYLKQVEPILRKPSLPIPDWCQQVNKRYGLPPIR